MKYSKQYLDNDHLPIFDVYSVGLYIFNLVHVSTHACRALLSPSYTLFSSPTTPLLRLRFDNCHLPETRMTPLCRDKHWRAR